jgi:hypothetical protein
MEALNNAIADNTMYPVLIMLIITCAGITRS